MKKHMTRNIILMLVLDVILGIVLFGDPANAPRLVCVGLIVAGILGLKLTSA